MLSQLGADRSKQAKHLSASIASRVYPNNSLSGQLVQSGGTRDRGVNIVSVPTKSGRLATMPFRLEIPCTTPQIIGIPSIGHIKSYGHALHRT